MYAAVKDMKNLQDRASVVNSGRTDGYYFYVGDNYVTVDNPDNRPSDDVQKELLEWFLSDREFELKND